MLHTGLCVVPVAHGAVLESLHCRLVRLYDERQGPKDCGVLRGHRDNVRDVRLSPDGVRLISAASDKFVRVWDLRSQRQCLAALQTHSDSVWSLESADEELRTFYSGGRDGQVCRDPPATFPGWLSGLAVHLPR